jgi:hypothetical protein
MTKTMYSLNYLVMQSQVIQGGFYKPISSNRLWQQIGVKLVRMHTIVNFLFRMS